jgi:hypothetical protein
VAGRAVYRKNGSDKLTGDAVWWINFFLVKSMVQFKSTYTSFFEATICIFPDWSLLKLFCGCWVDLGGAGFDVELCDRYN